MFDYNLRATSVVFQTSNKINLYIAFGSVWSSCCLIKFMNVIPYFSLKYTQSSRTLWSLAIFLMFSCAFISFLTGWSKECLSSIMKDTLIRLLENNILCILFYLLYFQMIIQKVYLLLESLDYSINFLPALMFLTDIYFS